ncbi:MAG: hypothetical protein LKK39_02735, partial [Oscillospiraceae bacterium]|nr:hypothetical protein [Oscillospiraceae bacterium]
LYEERLSDDESDSDEDTPSAVHFEGNIRFHHEDHPVSAIGNGPIDAFFKALEQVGIKNYRFVTYREHAIDAGADSKAVSYIQLQDPKGRDIFGVGVHPNISMASIKGIICAVNRAVLRNQKEAEE